MHVKISEFTHQRLVEGLGEELPIFYSDEQGFVRVDIPDYIVKNATENFGPDIDQAINRMINQNQREGLWPRKE